MKLLIEKIIKIFKINILREKKYNNKTRTRTN